MTNKSTLAQGLSHAWPWTKPIGSSPTTSRLLRYSLLCMLVLLCGGSVWAQDVTATLTGADLLASTSPSTSYADYTASETFTGLQDDQGNAYFGRWTYQKSGQTYLNMVQIKKVESSNTTRIQLPKYSGNIKKITLSVTNANSTAYDNGTGASTRLAIINSTTYTSSVANNTSNQVLVVGSSSTANKTYEFDFTQLENSYDGGGLYICSLDAAARIWSIVVTHDDGSSDTRTETALVFDGDYQTTGTAGGSMALPTALVKTVVDGVQTGTLNEPTITWESSNTTVATIADGTISFLKGGKTTITASYAGSSSYKSCSNSFDLTIGGAITDGVFDFNNNQDYGSGATVDGSAYITEDKTWTAGNVTLVTSGKYRWYTDGTLRLYAPDDGNTTLKLSVPEGNKITAITITGSSINSLTASIGTYSSGTWSGSAQEVTLSRGSDNSQVKTITVTYTSASAPEAPTFDPAAGNYYGPQNVTLTCTTEGADIYYSTDGENISKYTAPIEVSATTTISAYSQVGEEKSATVTATYTIRTLYTTIAQLHENVTDANTPIGFQPESVTVVYVNGNNGYLVDNAGNGLLVFNNSGLKVNGETDLAAGQVLTGGMIRGSLVSYQGSTEISGFTTEGTTITSTEVTPVEKTLPLNTDDDQSTLVTVKGLTYTAEGSTFSDGTNTIAYYDKFKANPTLEDGKKYDVTAIAVKYDNAIQLCPRTAADVTEYVAPTPDPFYILGVEGWELPADMKEMTWNAESQAYEYPLNNTSTAYFCFSTNNEVSDWDTFKADYRWALGSGGNYEFNVEQIGTALDLSLGDKTIVLPAGQWTISVTQDKKLTITGEAAEVTPTEDIYVVAGGIKDSDPEDPGFFVTWWAGEDEANQMDKQQDGTYSITYENVEIAAGTTYHFKFVKNGETWIPDGTDNNLWCYFEQAGTYNVTFTYDPNGEAPSGNSNVTIEKVEDTDPGFRDIKADLTLLQALATGTDVYITVAEDGTIGTTTDPLKSAATLRGGWHGTSYGWTNFQATVPVEGCVKITYATHDYGDVVTVTNTEGQEVAKFNTTGPKWSDDNSNVVVAYYRTDEPTALTFSQVRYNPYFAVEAIAEEDLPAEVTNYNISFVAGEDVEGEAPAAIEVEAGSKVTIPANYTLYKEGYTLTGWNDGTNNYAAGAEITPEADMTLNAVFTKNNVSLSDRTEAVTVTYTLNGSKAQYGFQSVDLGIIVTQATVNGETIDVKAATSGKFAYNGSGWHQMNNDSKVAVPSCKDATIVVNSYYSTADALTFAGSNEFDKAGETDGNYSATYTSTTDDATVEIAAIKDNTYINSIVITLPAPQEEEIEGLLYSWESPNGTVKEKGGKAQSFNGTTETTETDASDVNAINSTINSTYYTLRLSGAKDFSSKFVTITLDKKLHKGDIISITGYRNKNDKNKKTGALIKFEKGSETVTTVKDGDTKGLEFVNIDTSDASAEDLNRGTEPNTIELTVPESADGSKTITMTRAETGTNLFITKLVITSEVEDDPNAVETPMITPATGTYGSEQEVTITCETEDAKIYYTTDGTDPTAESTEYTVAFTVTETTTVKAIAIKGENSSEIAESVITITTVQPGTSNLEWDYTEKEIPTTSPDNGLNYAGYVNDAAGTNNGLHGVKLNSSGYAWFTKNPVKGKLTLTFGNRKTADAFAVNVYSCDANGTKGDKIGEVSVAESPGTGSIDIAADVPGIYIERSTSAEGVLQKIVFKEIIPRTFVGFEITNDELKGTYDPSKLPTGVDFSGTPHNDSHGYQNATIVVPTDGGAVKFTIGGCQYANPTTFTVTDAEGKTVATLDQKTPGCYHNGGTVTYFYTGEATTLTFGPMAYLPYFKAEAVEVQEVTVTYKDQDGKELGKKTFIEGEALGEVPYTEANLTIENGYAFRGWTYTNGVKVKATDLVDGNKSIIASVTAIEEAPTAGSIQVYDLTQSTFYPEDHENFDVNGGSWHDGQHGFSFGNGNSFSVKVSSKAQVVVTLCQHSSEGTVTVKDANNNSVGEGFNAKVASCGETAVVKYEGDATTLTFTFAATAYIHDVKVFNVNDFIEKDEVSGYYIVPAGDAVGLVLAINSAASEENSKIFLPNGTYDLGELVKTGISGSNVSIIGESMDGVIIKTTPDASIEGLGKSDLFQNSGTGLYLQDLTLQNAMAYSGNNARAAVLHDMGTNTICKNVKMLSYQDTYYSHKTGGLYYFEGGEIHGAVDYVCGNGKVYFNEVKFVNEQRSTATVSANSELYVFNNCTIENNANSYNLGRAWSDNPVCVWLNTTLMDPDKLISTRWNLTGINCDYSIAGEYGTKNAEGTDITPESNNVTFTKNNTQMNTILSADQAATYTINYVLGDWAATAQAEATQVTAPKAELKDGVISWEKVDGATAYAIFKDGKFLGITTENSWTVEDEAAPAPRRAGEEPTTTGYTIRAANSRGGFGEPAEVSPATGINATLNDKINESVIYDLNGRRVMTPTNGVYIINGKKVVIK